MATNNSPFIKFVKSPAAFWGTLAVVCIVLAWVFFREMKKIAVDDPDAKVKKISLWTVFLAAIFVFFMSIYKIVKPKASNGNGNFAAANATQRNAAARQPSVVVGSQNQPVPI